MHPTVVTGGFSVCLEWYRWFLKYSEAAILGVVADGANHNRKSSSKHAKKHSSLTGSKDAGLVVQNNAEQGAVYFQRAVVFDKSHLPESVHEEIHSRARCADHLRQRLLRKFGDNFLRLIFLPVVCQQ